MLTLIAHTASSTEPDQFWAFVGTTGVLAVVAAYFLFVITAFFSALFSPASAGMKLVWIIFIVIAPFIGSLLWFFVGKRNAHELAYR
ncbi:PLD nuclease N-terminal domain-containing protein [Kribbella sp. NPDC058245]|uniref:PLD nuclease N-terminal domain-containing protein n=1 Tax=Kribbella sp. NPDC058245 TaxID=3346399 RepID=UPI0036E9DB38